MRSPSFKLVLLLSFLLSFEVASQTFIQDVNDRKILNTAFSDADERLTLNVNRSFSERGFRQNSTIASAAIYLPHHKSKNDFGAVYLQEDEDTRRNSHFRLFYNFLVFENEDHVLRLSPELSFRHRVNQVNYYDSLGRLTGYSRGAGGMLNLGLNLSYKYKNFFVGWSTVNLLNSTPFGWPREHLSDPFTIETSRYQLITLGRKFKTKAVVIEPFMIFQAGPFQYRDQYHFNLRTVFYDRLLLGAQLLNTTEYFTVSLGWEFLDRFNLIYQFRKTTDPLESVYKPADHRISFQLR